MQTFRSLQDTRDGPRERRYLAPFIRARPPAAGLPAAAKVHVRRSWLPASRGRKNSPPPRVFFGANLGIAFSLIDGRTRSILRGCPAERTLRAKGEKNLSADDRFSRKARSRSGRFSYRARVDIRTWNSGAGRLEAGANHLFPRHRRTWRPRR